VFRSASLAEGKGMSPATTSISGLSSGIDWQKTVDSLMQLEHRRVDLLEGRQTLKDRQLSAWRAINTELLAFQSLAEGMEDPDDFLSWNASSSDTDLLTVETGSNTQEGSWGVQVNQLATATKLIHGGMADSNTTAVNSSGSDQIFAFTYGTGDDAVDLEITVTDGSTLAELRDLINNHADNDGVQATLLNDGSETATAWHLVLTSDLTGTDSALVIDDAQTTLGTGAEFDQAGFPDGQVGVNAQIRIDGYPAATWIESSSNSVENVLAGMTINLLGTTEGSEIQVTTDRDEGAVKGRIEAFVEGYNSVIELIDAYSQYDTETEAMGLLFGDGSLSQVERNLNQLTNRNFTGLDSSSHFTNLPQIGIRTVSGGKLEIDSDELDDALQNHFGELKDLFTFNSRTTSSSMSFFTRTTTVPAGDYDVAFDYDATGTLTSATVNGETADIDGDYVVLPESSTAYGLRLRFIDPGDGPGSSTATVSLSYGASVAAHQTLDALTDDDSGLVFYQTDRLETSITSLDEQIANMERRLDQTRAGLERDFIAMETLMSQLQGQSSSLSSQLSSL
jgi:flagellar hook-associated protein 2